MQQATGRRAKIRHHEHTSPDGPYSWVVGTPRKSMKVWASNSPRVPVSGHFTAQNDRISTSDGQNGPKTAQRDQKQWQTGQQTSVRLLTSRVQRERFGPRETQSRAFCGPCGAVGGRFANARPYSDFVWSETRIWLYLGLCGPIQFQGHCPKCKYPFLMVSNPTLRRGFGPRLPLSPGSGQL